MSQQHLLNTVGMLKRWGRAMMMREWMHLMAYVESDPPVGAFAVAECEIHVLEAMLFDGEESDSYVIAKQPLYENMILELE